MALTSGFYNAFKVDGDYDRKYNAEDYSDNMGAIIRSGVLRDANNGFRVTASGLVLSVSAGRAWINGHWAKLDTSQSVAIVTPPTGSYSRIDSVALRLNTNESVRAMSIVYTAGTVAESPKAPAPVRSGGIYDIVLAHIKVDPRATSVTITDTRPDERVCGWVTTPVGYDDWFKNSEAAFNDFFQSAKDQMGSVSMYKQYVWRKVLLGAATVVQFNIPQYDSTGVDIINVYVNGLLKVADVDYTLSGSVITFSSAKSAGDEIVVLCYKSIDGTGLGSVSDEITELQNQVEALGAAQTDYIYVCNGVDDNVKISDLVQQWLSGSTNDYSHKTIHIYGTFGVSAPYSGSGTVISPYIWFKFSEKTANTSPTRKITLDFSCCSAIEIECESGTYNQIFSGGWYSIFGANVIATGGTQIIMLGYIGSGGNCYGFINADKCRFWITAENGYIASSGCIRDCRCSVTATAGNAYVFYLRSYSSLLVYGGEYYAYCNLTSNSYVVWAGGSLGTSTQYLNNCAIATYGMSCPTVSRSGYAQDYAIYSENDTTIGSFTDTITKLTITAANQNVRGTLASSVTTLM